MYRKSKAEDKEAVYRLICDLEKMQLPYGEFCAIYREQVESEAFYGLVCEIDGEVMGILNLRFEKQLHHGGEIGEIMEFCMDPSLRGQGLGQEMYGEACRIARERGCMQLEIASNRIRKAAHRFYEKQGAKNTHFKFSMPL